MNLFEFSVYASMFISVQMGREGMWLFCKYLWCPVPLQLWIPG